jgi:trimeric autotransporter adhesin
MVSLGARNSVSFSHIALGAQATLAHSENRTETGGSLPITNGAHAAAIMLLGNYMAGSFAAAADGHGGTLITAAQTTNQLLLSAPHA